MVRIDARAGVMEVEAQTVLTARSPAVFDPAPDQIGVGRELFAGFRALVGSAEEGALAIPDLAHASLARHAPPIHVP
jgi:phosphogluconate dehydratase